METEPCDPALLSCITADEMRWILPLVFLVFGAIVIWRLVRSELNKLNSGQPSRRGTAPGKGETVTSINIPSQTRYGTDQTITVRHTKDPQKHAQAMMPAKARKKD